MITSGFGASQVWRKMIQTRDMVEQNIWWQLKAGTSSLWFDNCTKLGVFYFIEPLRYSKEEVEIKDFVREGVWDRQRLKTCLSDPEIVEYICDKVKPPSIEDIPDKAWWMSSNSGGFTIKTTWELMRDKNTKNEIDRLLWTKRGFHSRLTSFCGRPRRGELQLRII